MKVGKDHVIIKTRDHFVNKVKFGKGNLHVVDGHDLQKNTSMDGFNPAERMKYYAEVVSIPYRLSGKRIALTPRNPEGLPAYGPRQAPDDYHTYEGNEKVKYTELVANLYGIYKPEYYLLSDISQEVAVGDKIYFHYNVYKNRDNLIEIRKALTPEGKMVDEYYYKVRYDSIICAVRGGHIIMIGGWILVEPDMEEWEDILRPTYYDPKLTGGIRKERPKEQWTQTKVSPEAKYMLGYVRHIGTPLKDDDFGIKAGDHIYYHRKADWVLKIEGKEYFVMRQHYVFAKIENS